MRSVTPPGGRILAVLAATLLVACVSRGVQIREYVLTAAVGSAADAASARQVEIGVGPVALPPYLRRNEIVTRVSTNELRASDNHRWGEDLDLGLARVVAENLAVQVPGARVRSFPWRERAPAEYRVPIDVETFEREPDGSITLEGRWALLHGGGSDPVVEQRFRIREPAGGSDFAATVGAMSRAAARLSGEIADAIRKQAGILAAD